MYSLRFINPTLYDLYSNKWLCILKASKASNNITPDIYINKLKSKLLPLELESWVLNDVVYSRNPNEQENTFSKSNFNIKHNAKTILDFYLKKI